ncbi:MAG: roadblock/LC7 domain-containing protein [Chloroflexota bacterium]|nr:roadblock/LC7 domain-containing protein [Chloroflexota bacterium]
MEDILEDINAVVGVTGCLVCDEEGEVLARALPGVFDETMLSVVSRTAAQTVAGLHTARRKKVGDIDLIYTEGRLIVKNLGRGCLCILCVPRINVPLLNLTAKVAARKLARMLGKKGTEEAARAEPRAPEWPDAISEFIELLIKEMGDRGIGREELLKILQHRLERLKTEFPLLESIVIDGGKVDISALQSSSAAEAGEAVGALIRAICYTCIGMLGPEVAQTKYRQVYDPFYRQNESLFQRLGLGKTLEEAATLEKGPLPGGALKL